MLFYTRSYKATIARATTKTVTCENCNRAYTYQAVRKAQGFGESPFSLCDSHAEKRAMSAAERRCERSLEKAVNIVPCPHCGWYQKNMVGLGKRRRLFYTWGAGCIVSWLVLFWEFLGPSGSPSATGLPSVATFFAFFVAGIVWFFTYNPNRKVARK